MRSFAPRKHPAPGLQPGLCRKTMFRFSASICRQSSRRKTAGSSNMQPTRSLPAPAGQHLSSRILYRAPHFPVVYYFPPGASRQTTFRSLLYRANHSLTPASNFHSDLTGQYIPALILSLFFFHSTPLHTKKETGKADFHLFFLQSQI